MAATTEPLRVAGWVHAATQGLTGAAPPGNATRIVSAITAKGIAMARFDRQAITACVARAREVTTAAKLPNPVPHLTAMLLRQLTSAIGPANAARLLMSVNLTDADREVVRDLVFGLRSEPSPFDH